MSIQILPSPRDVAAEGARRIRELGQQAVKSRGAFHLCLSGGSTPKAIFDALAKDEAFARGIAPKTHLYWGDERSVPNDHADSNVRMAREHLIGPLNIPEAHVHAPNGAARDLAVEASCYERTLKEHLPADGGDGFPLFDVVMLGMGADGHTASLFPGTRALAVHDRLYVENQVPQMETWRLTATYEALNRAGDILIFVTGESKAGVIGTIHGRADEPEQYPIQKIVGNGRNVAWLLDEAAGTEVPPVES